LKHEPGEKKKDAVLFSAWFCELVKVMLYQKKVCIAAAACCVSFK